MNLILASIGVFLGIILLLVVILLVAKQYLTPSGKVKITINGEKELEVEQGSTLLNTLSVNGIYLSSACGGKGSCGQCKCQVVEGGGEILPSEKGHFSRKQQQDHWRLGCQVKVKGDLGIKIDESVLGVKEWECEVISNKERCHFHQRVYCGFAEKVNTWTSFRVHTLRLRFLNLKWTTTRISIKTLSVRNICPHGKNSVCSV